MAKKVLVIVLVFMFVLTGCAGKPGSSADSSDTPAAQATSAPAASNETSNGAGNSAHLSDALNLVMGSSDNPSVFDSYHIDLNLDIPGLSDDETSVVNKKTVIAADVQGNNVHIVQTDPGATASKEGYIIGDKEYKMVDGKPQEMMGQIALSWAMWPLQVVMPYAYAAYFAKQTGTDTLDGRAADVYTFDSADASAASDSMMSSFGLGDMTTGKGTVWIDHKTGGMLKLDMTYSDNVSDNNQKVIGSGTGTITIEISKVGQTTVTSPVQ